MQTVKKEFDIEEFEELDVAYASKDPLKNVMTVVTGPKIHEAALSSEEDDSTVAEPMTPSLDESDLADMEAESILRRI